MESNKVFFRGSNVAKHTIECLGMASSGLLTSQAADIYHYYLILTRDY